jgi:hypothetical protein
VIAGQSSINPKVTIKAKVAKLSRVVPVDSEYHQTQAVTLLRLARSTRDPDTAAALMRLAADHASLADKAAREQPKPGRDDY